MSRQIKKKKKKTLSVGAIMKRTALGAFFVAVIFLSGLVYNWFVVDEGVSRIHGWVDQKILTVTQDMGFEVRDILVEGTTRTDLDLLKGMINIERGDPLFSLDPHATQGLIERIDWVASARVERRFPDTVYIYVEERAPIALLRQGKALQVIDADGAVITSESADAFPNLIVIDGVGVADHIPGFVGILRGYPDVFDRAKAASWVGKRRWNLKLKPNIEVRLPEGRTIEALDSLAQIHAEESILDRKIEAIDLREEGRLVVRTAPGKVRSYMVDGGV